MTDSVMVTNLPDSGSRERVAYDLMRFLAGYLPQAEGAQAMQLRLDLYEQCLNVTRGGSGDAKYILR